jgi:stress response protein SCP2
MLTVIQVALAVAAVAVFITVDLMADLEKLDKVADKVLTPVKTDFRQQEAAQVEQTPVAVVAAANGDTQAAMALLL